jgi:Salmonella virulence plasmid 65kDa B protein
MYTPSLRVKKTCHKRSLLKREVDPATGTTRWVPAEPIIRGDYTVTRYRPRTEGLFARIEQWVKTYGPDAGDVHWRATTKDNVTSIYGKTPAARIVDPASAADAAKRHRVYEWLLQETFDDKGNHTLYEYAREDHTPAISPIYEQNRQHCQLYIRRIFYGNSNEAIGPMRRGTDHELESGEFCLWPELNAREYPCTLWMPSQRVPQKGYPLAQAHCTPFAHTPGFCVWLTPPSDQATMAACAAPRRCADCVGSAA